MTDKELLEAAARAAGYWSAEFKCADKLPRPGWNPLTDDGDSRRLQVKLRIHLEFAKRLGAKEYDRVQASPAGMGHLAEVVMFGNDEDAAVRLAVLRVAVSIGQAQGDGK